MDTETRARVAELFASLSNPVRLRITELLVERGELSVNEICAALSLRQSATSQNLAILVRSGLLAADQRGSTRLYRVRGPRIGWILRFMEQFCDIHKLYGSASEPMDDEVDPSIS